LNLSYRIWPPMYETDAQFGRLVASLDAHRSAIDEISLFTDYWHHGFHPLDRFAELSETMRDRIDALHAAGFASVGANVLSTMGHLDEAWDFFPMPFPTEMYIDGTRAKSMVCPSSSDWRRYIAEKYAMVAKANPDFIWVDDDMRMARASKNICFCPVCLAMFDGGRWTRETLSAEIGSQTGSETRAAWAEWTVSTIEDILRIIEQTVHAVAPRTEIGLMTTGVGSLYTNDAAHRWFAALGGTRGRLGGGFYSDAAPREMLEKSLAIARGCIAYPATVTNIQYELENFPYQKLGKSVATVLNECALSFACGCNGVAFNALKDLPGSMEPYEELMTAIELERPAWDSFLDATPGTRMVGLYIAERPNVFCREPEIGDTLRRMPQGGYAHPAQILMEIGVPITLDPAGATGTVLSGNAAAYFDDASLERILDDGALIDGTTSQILFDRGLGHLCGVRVGRSYDNGVYERFSRHPLNGPYAEDARDARLAFWSASADSLEATVEGVETLSCLVGYDGSELGVCASAFVNAEGGKVVTLGYAPWTLLSSSAKRTQVLNAVDWISGSTLPMLIPKVVRVTPLVRVNEDGTKLAAVLLNTSYDSSGSLEIRMRTSASDARLLTRDGIVELQAVRLGHDLVVTLPSIAPWRYLLVVAGN